jgi:Fe-coproporphyrin III synthase
LIVDQTKKMFDEGWKPEILTVDNHADGPYLYLKMKEQDPVRAREILELLEMNEGNSSGQGIGCVSWDGEVYPDQFWRNQPLGNVRRKPFSEIWMDKNNEFLMKLKEKKKHLHGRCAACSWLSVCGGNFRARAEAAGDLWGPDPACYLSDQEITVKEDVE